MTNAIKLQRNLRTFLHLFVYTVFNNSQIFSLLEITSQLSSLEQPSNLIAKLSLGVPYIYHHTYGYMDCGILELPLDSDLSHHSPVRRTFLLANIQYLQYLCRSCQQVSSTLPSDKTNTSQPINTINTDPVVVISAVLQVVASLPLYTTFKIRLAGYLTPTLH